MELKATEEEIKKFLEDKYADIEIGDYSIYLELNNSDSILYTELMRSKNRKIVQKYSFDTEMLEKFKAKRPCDSSWNHNDPLCPSCNSYMIYPFDYCPKCGQKLDWSEK